MVYCRVDLAEGIALRGGVNLDRLQSLLDKDKENTAVEPLSPYAYSAHSRFLPELSLGNHYVHYIFRRLQCCLQRYRYCYQYLHGVFLYSIKLLEIKKNQKRDLLYLCV